MTQPSVALESPGSVAARCLLVGGLFGAPLAFGAVQPWAWGGLGVIIAIAVLLCAVGALQQRTIAVPRTDLYLPLVAVWLLGTTQYLARTSVDPIATREALVKGAIYLTVFLLAGALFVNAGRAAWSRFGMAVTTYTFALSLFAILQFFSNPYTVYGFIVPRAGGAIFGPYVNHNNYAGLLELLLPLTAAYGMTGRPGSVARWWTGFTCLMALASVGLSGSRAGMSSIATEGVLFAMVVLWKAPTATRPKLAIGTVLAGVAAVGACIWLMPPGVISTYDALLNSDPSAGFRVQLTADALRIAGEHPLAGVGLGGFETAYPQYQSFASDYGIDYAHNDAAQLVAETGFAGGVLVLLALVIFGKSAIRFAQELRGDQLIYFRFAAAVGILGLLIHSLFDFNLHIPANAAWLALCGGLVVAARRTNGVAC